MKRPTVPYPMCNFIESITGEKLMPWQRSLVEMLAHADGRHVVFMPARRNGISTVRAMCAALRAAN